MSAELSIRATPFNSPVELGLRALSVLSEAYPNVYSLQKLIVFDYLTIHSDDLPDGPPGLHPKTPHRSGELLVRRDALQKGLLLFQSRGLIVQSFQSAGVYYGATETSAAYLDSLSAEYSLLLRERASWVVTELGKVQDSDLATLVREHIGVWGAEFEMESVLWSEEQESP